MSLTSRKNLSVKALQSQMAKEKKNNQYITLEHQIACNTSPERGLVISQSIIKANFHRDDWKKPQGATKTVHCHNELITDEHGEHPEFKFICIKRHKTGGYIDEHQYDSTPLTGNQLIDEILTWEALSMTPEADLLCPIMKYFTSKSDKVSATSEKMQENVVIIAQKAQDIGDAEYACKMADYRNAEAGIMYYTLWDDRLEEMEQMASRHNWRDVIYNGGNCGVIYDYNQNCYKAVFIDYGL